MAFLITTTGLSASITFADLGARTFTHPTTDYNLTNEYSIEEIKKSNDLAAALDNGYITAKYNGIAITSSTQLYSIGGDMLKIVYDANNNNIVDDSERLGGYLPSFYTTTTNISEGSNLYFTIARARQSISGTANVIDYNQTTGNITIAPTYTGQASITTLGTVTTGTWNATPIGIAYGGTGQTTKTAAFDTLAPTITKGDIIVHNGTNNIKLPIGINGQDLTPDFLQPSGLKWVTPATYQALPSNPSGTISTSGVMMGLAGSITPTKSGEIMIVISGNLTHSQGQTRTSTIQLRTGTGLAPANGTSLTGVVHYTLQITFASNFWTMPFTVNAIVTSLTIGTTYWIDLSLATSNSANTSSLSSISISAIEL
jgi:hypothetical protein